MTTDERSRTLRKIEGHTQGLKASELRALERLFRRRVDPSLSVTPDLVRELATRSAAIARRVGVLIDRSGSVTRVFVGDAKALEVPDLGKFRRGAGRLKGLRWIATTTRGEAPSRGDLNALIRWRLDLLVLVGVGEDGEPTFAREVHLVPAQEDGKGATELGPRLLPHQVRDDLPEFIRELEERFEAATPSAQETEAESTRAVLAAVSTGPGDDVDEDLAELRELARAAGFDVRGELHQRRNRINPATLLGKGRVHDLAALALTVGAELVVFAQDLAPRQQVALEDLLGVRVIDRTQLILDLFAQRARTHAGKLQVEAARLRYLLPRLLGRGSAMTRIGGGKGAGFARTKGAGEKKLEIDRRRIRTRIDGLEKELRRLGKQRAQRRRRRRQNRLPHVALVGYTNVGKSTLFNRLTNADVRVEDQLFASLDPTLRQRRLPSGRRIVLSDSVGFIRRLPKDLVEAFSATLDELEDATLLLHVADASDPQAFERVEAVRTLLRSLGRGDTPELLVFNKTDLLDDAGAFRPLAHTAAPAVEPVLISAREGDLGPLVGRLDALLEELVGDDSDALLVSDDLTSGDDLEDEPLESDPDSDLSAEDAVA